MSLFDDASLVLIPDGAKDGTLYSVKPTDGTGDFTFTRGSNLAATRVDENGLIEKGRENLLFYSQDFSNANWQTNASATISHGITDPNGGSTASRLTFAASVNSGLYQRNLTLLGSGNVRTASLYMKGAVGGENVMFGDGSNRTSVTLTTSWVRYEGFAIDASTFFIIYTDTSSPSADTIDIAFAQYENGLVATDYIETGATTAQAGILEDMPRLDYSGGASCPSLLLEPSRTQLVGQSEYFDGSYWPKADVVVTNNAAISPDGKLNASKLIASATNANHLLNKPGFLGITSGQSYTFSIFAKAAEYDFVRLQFQTGPFPVNYANFDLTNGTIGLNTGTTDTKIESFGNGWYKCIMVVTATSTANSGFQPFVLDSDRTGTSPSYLGDGTSGIYIWGAQCEQASYPTSYIPTYGTSVTRSGDSCSKTGISSLINSEEGVLYAEMSYSETTRLGLSDGSNSNRVLIGQDSDGDVRAIINVSGSTIFNVASAEVPNTLGNNLKIAIKYKENDFALWLNGVEVADTSSGVVFTPNTLTALDFSGQGINAYGKTKQIIYFPTALTDTQLAAITTL